jgi:TatD DNase family protein
VSCAGRLPIFAALLADSHVHLHAYSDEEVEAMLERASAVGVGRILAVSIDLPSARRTLALRRAGVSVAVGWHPRELRGIPADGDWAELERLAERADAIGECGVDVGAGASGAVQLTVLARHCRLAVRLGKPLLLHLFGERLVGPALGVLAATRVAPGRAVAHYFQGDAIVARRLLDAGLLISVGKPVTRSAHVKEAVREVPLHSLLLETDTYPLPGRTTEPADVRLVAEAVAEVKGLSVAEVAEATAANLERLLVGGAAGG